MFFVTFRGMCGLEQAFGTPHGFVGGGFCGEGSGIGAAGAGHAIEAKTATGHVNIDALPYGRRLNAIVRRKGFGRFLSGCCNGGA